MASGTEECTAGRPGPHPRGRLRGQRGRHHRRGGGRQLGGATRPPGQYRGPGRLRPGHHRGRHQRLRRRGLGSRRTSDGCSRAGRRSTPATATTGRTWTSWRRAPACDRRRPSADGSQTHQAHDGHLAGHAPRDRQPWPATWHDHPGTSPGQMRRLVRAAGRLDWDIALRSRSGPASTTRMRPHRRARRRPRSLGPPACACGSPAHASRWAGRAPRRRARVDVQRGGGYGGLTSSACGACRGRSGTATFDRPGASLAGLDGLGARLDTAHRGQRP